MALKELYGSPGGQNFLEGLICWLREPSGYFSGDSSSHPKAFLGFPDSPHTNRPYQTKNRGLCSLVHCHRTPPSHKQFMAGWGKLDNCSHLVWETGHFSRTFQRQLKCELLFFIQAGHHWPWWQWASSTVALAILNNGRGLCTSAITLLSESSSG